MGERTRRTMVGDSGKSNKDFVPRGPPPRGAGLDNNCNYGEGRGIFQRYRVGGGDLEVGHLHFKQPPIIRHHST